MPTSSRGPPTSAVLPSVESATLWPNSPAADLFPAFAVSFAPCWVQVDARAREHPRRADVELSPAAHRSARCCRRRRARRLCRSRLRRSPRLPVSLTPCWVQVEPERVNTHAAPTPTLAPPRADPRSARCCRRRRAPRCNRTGVAGGFAAPISSEAFAIELFALLFPFGSRARETHAAPTSSLSPGPPSSASLPSAESATLLPNSPAPASPLPLSFAPCWAHVVVVRRKTHAAPTPGLPLSLGPPISAYSCWFRLPWRRAPRSCRIRRRRSLPRFSASAFRPAGSRSCPSA